MIGITLSAAVVIIIAALVGGVLSARRGHDGYDSPGITGHSIRRFFQYALLSGLLFASASGVSGLVGRLLESDQGPLRDDTALALQLTFTFIALPLWAALAWWTHRRLRTDPAEPRAVGWVVYLTLVSLVSLVVALVGWHRSVGGLAGLHPLHGDPPGQTLVWTVVWLGHHWWSHRVTPTSHLRPLHLLGSLVSLVGAGIGLGMVLTPAFGELLGLNASVVVGRPVWPSIAAGAAVLLVAGLAWSTYWLRHMLHSRRDTGWLAIVLLAGVAGGLLLAVLTASILGWDVLVWLVGDPRHATAARHFHAAPAQLAAVVVGLLVWWYHREVLDARPRHARTEVRRVYEYLLSAVGLLAASAGLVMVLVTIVEAVASGADLVVGGTALNALLGALVLLAVGLPVWWWHWRQAQRARKADPGGEVGSPTRRAYLLVLFGVMGVAAVIALLMLVYLVLEDVLEGGVDAETLRRIRFVVGILVTTGLLSAYHWTVFRADRAEAERIGPRTPVDADPRTVRMTVPGIDIEVRDGLVARAAEAGVPVEEYVRRVLAEAARKG
ncbi:DUF5671 domain-containing protein [Ornithinimicrobium panacihumi]|uniref:DUF5671 domain-containing protein n=1 Tax=Ornithinimicrobium panacihumi TaxID=2008449 RepID=UPI003F8B7621